MTRAAVGVVGTGAMGMGVVRSLRRHGVATFTRDVRDDANATAAGLGAIVCDAPQSVAQHASIVILLVVDDVQIDDVLFGARGAAAAFAAGGIVVVSSTVDPQYVQALAPRLAAHGVTLVDAPVSGGPAKADAGTMTMMVSGPRDAREACAPVFARIAGRVFEVGDAAGQAAAFKVVNNLLAAANLAAGAEALALAERAGLALPRVFDVVNASSGASWILADRMERALAGDRGVRAATRVLAKDASIALALAERLGANASFARAAAQAFGDACAAGFAEEDDSAILRLGLCQPIEVRR